MDDNENAFLPGMIDKCRNCDGDIVKKISPGGTMDPEDRRCLLCDRYYRQGRLFLNNVG
jgi:hypothetical protein